MMCQKIALMDQGARMQPCTHTHHTHTHTQPFDRAVNVQLKLTSLFTILFTVFSATAVPFFRNPPSFVFSSAACSITLPLNADMADIFTEDLAIDVAVDVILKLALSRCRFSDSVPFCSDFWMNTAGCRTGVCVCVRAYILVSWFEKLQVVP